MNFEESYFEGEEREGFFVEPMMKRAWAAQLEVLETVDAICRRNNIEYFASSGTLLGAIRHGGYIPWDDDLDIEMKRLDYERFLKIVAKELPQEYRIITYTTDSGWNKVFARVVNTSEIPLKNERLQEFHGFPWSAGVDIFPLDFLPVDKSEEDGVMKLFRISYMLASDWDKEELSEDEKMEALREVEDLCNIKFSQDIEYKQQLWRLAERIGAMYWDTDAVAEEVAIIYILASRPHFRIPSSCYKNTKRVPFENTTIPIPVDYEPVLIANFGEDYMTPKQGTAGHEYPYYRKQQKLLIEFYKNNGIEVADYLLE